MNLKQIRDMDNDICYYRAQIAMLEAKVTHITTNIASAIDGESASNSIEKIVPKIADLREELHNAETKKANAISSIPPTTLQGSCLLLRLEYGYEWKQIAQKVGGGNTEDGIRVMCNRYEW